MAVVGGSFHFMATRFSSPTHASFFAQYGVSILSNALLLPARVSPCGAAGPSGSRGFAAMPPMHGTTILSVKVIT